MLFQALRLPYNIEAFAGHLGLDVLRRADAGIFSDFAGWPSSAIVRTVPGSVPASGESDC